MWLLVSCSAQGVPGEPYNVGEKAMDERTIGHNPERMSLLKGGIVYANAVTTVRLRASLRTKLPHRWPCPHRSQVSPTYASETLHGGGAGWLKDVLTQYKSKYHGVLNGIDTLLWDAARDPLLPANFMPGAMHGKATCKKYLQMGLGLEARLAFTQAPYRFCSLGR